MPVIAMTERRIAAAPEAAAAAIRAIVRTQAALKADPALATRVGARLFPPAEAALIEELVRRDLPYYDAAIAQSAVAAMNRFARDMGLLSGEAPYEAVVATPFRALWRPATPADRLVATDAATPARNGGNAT
jgi:ABC-type nitrate/sulfonate/bicarbonate transport system substrate-binding protein